MTSQSTQIVRSPIWSKSTIDLSVRPIKRWISIVLPPTFPLDDSRIFRVSVARGNMAYSAVIQPFPCPRINGGTRSSILALQITFVSPMVIKTDPSGCLTNSVSIVISLNSVLALLFGLIRSSSFIHYYRNIFFAESVTFIPFLLEMIKKKLISQLRNFQLEQRHLL